MKGITFVSKIHFISVLVCLLLLSLTILPSIGAEQNIENDVNIAWYESKLDNWGWQARALRILQTIFAIIAIVSSVYASSKLPKPKRLPEGLLTFIAAVSIALFVGLDLNTQANKLRTAWRILSVSVREYKESDANIKIVRDAYSKAEHIIGEYSPGPK